MNAPLVRTEPQFPVLALTEADALAVLESSLYPGAQLHSIKAVLSWCKANGMDPMTKPVHIVPMSVKKAGTKDYEWRDVIMPGIETYRTKAARTQAYAGIAAINYGDTRKFKIDEFELEYPEWCEVVVMRIVGGKPFPFTSGRVRWMECYATAGKDTTKPNAMWKKRAFGQLEKCAEAMALRRAFPEAIGAELTMEELAGKTLGEDAIEGTATRVEVEQPKSKTNGQPAASESAAPKPHASESKPVTAGALKTIRAQMHNAALSDLDVKARFGHDADGVVIENWTLESLDMAQVNAVLEFIRNPAQQA